VSRAEEVKALARAANALSEHWDAERAERDALNRAIVAMPDNWTVRPELRGPSRDDAE